MIQFIQPAHKILKKYIAYMYAVRIDDTLYRQNLMVFPNVGSAITFCFDTCFVEQAKNKFISFEKKGSAGAVLHINREDAIQILEEGKQKRFVIVFKPFGVNQFIDFPSYAGAKNPSIIPLNDFDEFLEVLDAAPSFTAAAQKIEGLLLKKFAPVNNAVLENCISKIMDEHYVRIDDLASATGASVKTISRFFKYHTGLSPAAFRKLVQFRSVVKDKFVDDGKPFIKLAENNYYYDLSYMKKKFKELTGNHPNRFFNSISTDCDKEYVYQINPG